MSTLNLKFFHVISIFLDDGDNEHAAKKLKLDHSGHKSKPENYVFPSNLKEFKYYFNKG